MKQIITGSKQVVLVSPDDSVLGSMDIFAAHAHPAQLHRASSVMLKNQQQQILLQQRSLQKITGATWWANTACGNVKPEESYLDCAYRRLQDEMGIAQSQVTLKPLYSFEYQVYCNSKYGEHEIDQIFVGTFTEQPQPNSQEVSETIWIESDSIISQIATISFPSPQETTTLPTQKLKTLTPPIPITYQNQSYLLAPWTVFILRDQRFQRWLRE